MSQVEAHPSNLREVEEEGCHKFHLPVLQGERVLSQLTSLINESYMTVCQTLPTWSPEAFLLEDFG